MAGWGNNELEVYTENNVLVTGGYLSLTASFDGTNFLSGRIRTFAKRDFVPSKDTPNGIRIEASIQMPTGKWEVYPTMHMALVHLLLPAEKTYIHVKKVESCAMIQVNCRLWQS